MSLAAFFQTTLRPRSSTIVVEIQTVRPQGNDVTVFIDKVDITDAAGNAIPGMIKNDSFELPAINTGYSYTDVIDHWTFTSGLHHGLVLPGSAFNSPQPVSGNQSLFLQHDNVITQNVELPSGRYKVRLYASNRGTDTGDLVVVVRINGVEVLRYTPAVGTYVPTLSSAFEL